MCTRGAAAPRWLDSWRGVGNVAAGIHRQGWDLQLTEYGDGRWAGDVLRDGRGALHRRWLGLGVDAVAGCAAAVREGREIALA